MNATNWRTAFLTTLLAQVILLLLASWILDGARTFKALCAFTLVWDAALITGMLVQTAGHRKLCGLRISVWLGIAVPVALFVFATQVRLHLKMEVDSVEYLRPQLKQMSGPKDPAVNTAQ